MGIFSKFLNKDDENSAEKTRVVKFGRFSENGENDFSDALRQVCDEFYEKHEYVEAYITLFNYLQKYGGPAIKVTENQKDDSLEFTLIQGSKTVKGSISSQEVFVRAEVASFTKLNVALMRYLLTQNSNFSYCKFAIEGNVISLVQRCPARDMSPKAFKEMLSELARNADGIDDVLVDEFASLIPINVDNIVYLPEEEVETKLFFIRCWIEETEKLLLTTDNETTRTYIIFRLIFKLLYLISPEGTLLNELRWAYHTYEEFDENEGNAPEINFKMMEIIRGIYRKTDEELAKSLYTVPAVFPELSYVPFGDVVQSLAPQLDMVEECVDARREDLVVVVCEFLVGSHQFHQGMPQIATDLLLVFWRTLNPEFFVGLGFEEVFYDSQTQKLKAMKISEEIDRIIRYYSKYYKGLSFNTANLDFGSQANFAYTFLQEFCVLGSAF